MRGRPAPGRAPPRPTGLNSMLVCRGWRRRRACRGRRLRVFRGRRFPCTRRHLCDPAFEKEATRNYCICQQYFCSSVTLVGYCQHASESRPRCPATEHRPFHAGQADQTGYNDWLHWRSSGHISPPRSKRAMFRRSLVTRHTKNCPPAPPGDVERGNVAEFADRARARWRSRTRPSTSSKQYGCHSSTTSAKAGTRSPPCWSEQRHQRRADLCLATLLCVREYVLK